MAASRKIYVDAVRGRDLASGASETRTRASITAGLALAESGRGDTIFIAPGSYNEPVIITKDYVRLVALYPGGYGRPDIVPTTGIPIIVRAQGVVLQGLRMASADNDCLKIEGNGGRLLDCVLDGNLVANKGGLRLQGHATNDSMTASEWQIGTQDLPNLVRGNAIGIIFDTAPALVGVGSTHNRIGHNMFVQNTIDLATKDSGPGVYSLQFTLIEENLFMDKDKATYIDFTTANGGAAGDQSGLVAGNYFGIMGAVTTTHIKAVGTAFAFSGNRNGVGVFDGTGLD